MSMNKAQLAVQFFGSQQKMADALGIPSQVVHNWTKRGLPPKWVKRIAKASGGYFQAVDLFEYDSIDAPKFTQLKPLRKIALDDVLKVVYINGFDIANALEESPAVVDAWLKLGHRLEAFICEHDLIKND